MIIKGMKQTLPGVYEITPDAGSAFFLRKEYLSLVSEDQLIPFGYGRLDVNLETATPQEGDLGFLNSEESADVMHAALVYSVEKAAMSYLARAEHCRAGLYKKLLAKQLDKDAVNLALDYLESVDYLSDYRFAGAWLRSRSIDHYEGRIRLTAELAMRGVDKEASRQALDEFFSTKDEVEICEKAYAKLKKSNKDELKLRAALMRLGFSIKIIKTVLS